MIYSKENNFLLLDNIKVGSTSLKLSLLEVLPDTAIVSDPGSGRISVNLDPKKDAKILELLEKNKKHNKETFKGFIIEPHISYYHVKEYFKDDDIDGTESCIFIRHPYEQVFSHFVMMLQYESIVQKFFTQYTPEQQQIVLSKYFSAPDRMASTSPIYTDEKKNIQVKHVFRYEKGLENEINTLLPKVGLPTISVKYNAKQYKPRDVTYRNYFRDEHYAIIQQDWAWEFEEFKYDK